MENFGVKPVNFSGFSMLAHACSFVLTYSFLSPYRQAYGGQTWGILPLNLLKSAFLTYLLMFAHTCSYVLSCDFFHLIGSQNIR